MASVKLLNIDGVEQGELELNEKVFDVLLNETLVHDVVVSLQNAKRQGTHKSKTRREVSGGGQKPFRQKGTGRARQGSIREPHMRGGGSVFGPKPRSYRQAIPIRIRRQALCCVLSECLRQQNLCAITDLTCEAPKTSVMAQMIQKVLPDARKTLLVLSDIDKNILLSTRNIPRVEVRTAADLNALDVLLATKVVVQQEAFAKLEERLT